MRCICDIKFGMLQVRKNEISLRKRSGGSPQLRTSRETLVTRESARFDNNDSEPKSQVSLHKFPEENKTFLKTHVVESILSFSPMAEWEWMLFAKRQLQTTKWENSKINFKTTGDVPSQIWPFFKSQNHALHSLQIHWMLMYRWWLSSWLTICYKLVCCRDKTDRNTRKSGSKKSVVNATLRLISDDRFRT